MSLLGADTFDDLRWVLMSHSASPQTAETEDVRPMGDEEIEDVNVILRHKVWQGKIPAKISLAANESKSFTNTPPLFVSPSLRERN